MLFLETPAINTIGTYSYTEFNDEDIAVWNPWASQTTSEQRVNNGAVTTHLQYFKLFFRLCLFKCLHSLGWSHTWPMSKHSQLHYAQPQTEAGMMKALVLPFQLTRMDQSPAISPAACHAEIGSCSQVGHGWLTHRCFLNPQPALQGRYPEMDWCKSPLPPSNGEIPGASYTQRWFAQLPHSG